MKIYIHQETGVATSSIDNKTALQSLSGVLDSTLHLDCVFHNGTAAVELASTAVGACILKRDKHYTAAALVQALSWTKASAPEDGYRFTFRLAGEALEGLLANQDSETLMLQVAWEIGDLRGLTQKIGFSVANAVYRDNEPEIEVPDVAWPLPANLVLKSDLAAYFSGQVKYGDTTITYENGLLKTFTQTEPA